jgi:hypothetical protein
MAVHSAPTRIAKATACELAGMLPAYDIDALARHRQRWRPVGMVAEADILTKLEFHGGADMRPLLAGAHCRARWYK